MRRLGILGVLVVAGLLFLPALAAAQASISGLVQDSSGAVLPGVTVEAASPVLIEKARTVVTDGAGRYSIVDLRPGTYTVTFALSGFNTVKREGIVLQGTFDANVNADLRVGTLQETVTLSGGDDRRAGVQHRLARRGVCVQRRAHEHDPEGRQQPDAVRGHCLREQSALRGQ